jgi:GT2 family glycosyltransferase/SAM-dependent methyltransferase
MEMKVSVVLVTYNCSSLVRRCIARISEHTTGVAWELLAVDNDSRDGTADMIVREFPQVKLLRNGDNVGFARACNQAFSHAAGEYILWLNTDCFLINNALAEMAACLDAHPDVGIVGARLFNEDGSYQSSCRKFLSLPTEFFLTLPLFNKLPIQSIHPHILHARTATGPIPVPFVSGACLMFRRAVHDQIGGLDERFFMYCEEEDFCRRARVAGWRTMYVPSAQAVHLGGASAPTLQRCTRLYDSKLLYYRKHHSAFATAIFRVAMAIALTLRLTFGMAAMLIPGKSKTGKALATEGAAGLSSVVASLKVGLTATKRVLKHAIRRILVAAHLYPHLRLWLQPFKKIEFKTLNEKAQLGRGDVVLDVGCGGGVPTVLLAKRCKRAVGIDVSSDAIAIARRDSILQHNVEFHAKSLQEAAFPSDTFDKVLSFSVLEHIPEYVDVLNEIRRVLKPGGALVFSCDALETIDNPALIEKHRTDHFVHQYFTAPELRNLLQRLGFTDVNIEPLFCSEYAKAMFSRGIRNRFIFGVIRATAAYVGIRWHELRARGSSKGIFLVVSCHKPVVSNNRYERPADVPIATLG